MKTKILKCVCSLQDDEYTQSLTYHGMPQLKVSDMYEYTNKNGKKIQKQYYEAYCPKCGRGGLIQHKSAYLALEAWNDTQKRCRRLEKMYDLSRDN